MVCVETETRTILLHQVEKRLLGSSCEHALLVFFFIVACTTNYKYSVMSVFDTLFLFFIINKKMVMKISSTSTSSSVVCPKTRFRVAVWLTR